ncbi:MAG: ribonuclease E/G, partial [Actinomycetales bacterium]|nr:ribonuclease E/G [Actinomycetales bacterium]
IIVIDFIDMVLESNRDLVLRRLVECLGRDRTKHQVAEVTSLGLVQMTRKRVGQGLVETFSTTCEHCSGRGLVVDVDGTHSHGGGNGGGNGGDDSSKSSRRRGRRSRNGSKGEDESSDSGAEEAQADVHRLEDDADSRALARATIASIAAASGASAQPEAAVDGDGEVVTGEPAEADSAAPSASEEQDSSAQG